MKKRKFKKIYDYCIDNDSQKRGRYITRKERIPSAIISSLVLIAIALLSTLHLEFNKYIIIDVLCILVMFMLQRIFRCDILTLINVIKLRRIEKKNNRSCLEELILEINYENSKYSYNMENFKYLSINDFIWSKISFYYFDKEFKNKYIIKVNVDKITIQCKLSKKSKAILKTEKLTEILKDEYKMDYFNKIHSINDLKKEILKIYLTKRNLVLGNINNNKY